MKLLLLLFLLVSNPAAAYTQTEWTLFRNAQTPLSGYPSGIWHWPGVAFSASTFQLYAHLDLSIDTCRFAYSFNPRSGPSPTGLRLVALDMGSIVPLATVTVPNVKTPTSGGVNITHQMRRLLNNKRGVTIALQTVGNGVSGPLIYHAVVECVWQP
jgi:hypothetical protein